MKKLCSLLLALMLCMMTATAFAVDVPRSSSNLPDMPRYPDTPRIIRVQKDSASLTLTLDRELPAESLVTVLGVDADCRIVSLNAVPGEDCTHSVTGLPEGGQWMGFEIAWVDGEVNALAKYNVAGGLDSVTRYDDHMNGYVYDNTGAFYEFVNSVTDVHARFDSRGRLICYGYTAIADTCVWFNLEGDVLWAEYNNGEFAATWLPDVNWYVDTPAGRVKARLNVSPWGSRPLFTEEEDEEEEQEIVWYPNNTICVAGLSLQEADESLPNKWYNILPVDLTKDGRQTYTLTISDAHLIGECYVDVWGDEVTVSFNLIENSAIEPLSSYGRWFTNLSQITTDSIEASEDGFVFGEPVSISAELGGVDTALLFIRSKATYYLPFKDGSAMTRYWRNSAPWKEFRQSLQELMPSVAK